MTNRRFLFSALAISFFVFICWVIVVADQGQTNIFIKIIKYYSFGDEVGHVVLFGTLAFLVNLALQNKRIKLGSISLLLGTFLVGTFAILEEFTQLNFASRHFSLSDILCDLIGLVLFSYLSVWFEKKMADREILVR